MARFSSPQTQEDTKNNNELNSQHLALISISYAVCCMQCCVQNTVYNALYTVWRVQYAVKAVHSTRYA